MSRAVAKAVRPPIPKARRAAPTARKAAPMPRADEDHAYRPRCRPRATDRARDEVEGMHGENVTDRGEGGPGPIRFSRSNCSGNPARATVAPAATASHATRRTGRSRQSAPATASSILPREELAVLGDVDGALPCPPGERVSRSARSSGTPRANVQAARRGSTNSRAPTAGLLVVGEAGDVRARRRRNPAPRRAALRGNRAGRRSGTRRAPRATPPSGPEVGGRARREVDADGDRDAVGTIAP